LVQAGRGAVGEGQREVLGPALTSLHENKAPVRATIQDAVQRVNAILAGR